MSDLCPRCGRHPAAAFCPEAATQLAASQEDVLSSTQLDPAALSGAAPPSSSDLAAGTLVGEYRVSEMIGAGGMGAVYAAVHPLIGRKVAIKVLHGVAVSAEGAQARFLQEARTASLVRHRNIVDVFAFGQLRDGRSYLVMEFLEGETLASYLRRRGPLSVAEALPIVDGICAGLKAAHDKGVVHRDLKPDNVWILPADEDQSNPSIIHADRIKILDFGLAKVTAPGSLDQNLTRAGAPLGTPAFMSPEQCRGEPHIDHRTDIYALGVILYEIFTMQVPFSGASFVEVAAQHLSAIPPSLTDGVGMPPDLEDVIHRALAKDPADRFQSVAELRAALHEAGCIDWSPRPASEEVARARAGAAEPTRVPGEPVETAAAGFAPFRTGGLAVAPRLDDDEALTLAFSGELESPEGAAALGTWLGDLTDTMQGRVRRVVLDLEGLGFFDHAGLSCLSEWVALLREMRAGGLDPTTVRYSQSVSWQRAWIARLERLDPALLLEAV